MIQKDHKAVLHAIHTDLVAAFATIAAKHNLTKLDLGKITYTDSGFHAKVEGVFEGGLSKEAQMYQMMQAYPSSNLPPLDTEFDNTNGRYKIIGMNSTRTKVICTHLQKGKNYLFPLDLLRSIIGAQKHTASETKQP
jgi:hypothetical protein